MTCKGAPEALRPLLREVPADYDALYEQHASRGMRVLALASRTVSSQDWKSTERSTAEADLIFRASCA